MRGKAMIRSVDPAAILFAFVALSIFTLAIVGTRLSSDDLFRFGLTFDVVITVPLLYWLIVIRRRRASLLGLIPLIVVCQIVARFLIHGDEPLLQQLALLAAPLELALLTFVGVRVRRAIAASPQSDPVSKIRDICRRVLPNPLIAGALSFELTMLWFGLLGWRFPSAVIEKSSTTFHRRDGWGSIALSIVVVIIAEGIGAHLLLHHWSPAAAWIMTVFDLWALVWLAGDYHGLRTIPTSIEDDQLLLRFGLRWSGKTSIFNIAEISTAHHPEPDRTHLHFGIFEKPSLTIHFRDPIPMTGFAGMVRSVESVSLSPDGTEFSETLRTLVEQVAEAKDVADARN